MVHLLLHFLVWSSSRPLICWFSYVCLYTLLHKYLKIHRFKKNYIQKLIFCLVFPFFNFLTFWNTKFVFQKVRKLKNLKIKCICLVAFFCSILFSCIFTSKPKGYFFMQKYICIGKWHRQSKWGLSLHWLLILVTIG